MNKAAGMDEGEMLINSMKPLEEHDARGLEFLTITERQGILYMIYIDKAGKLYKDTLDTKTEGKGKKK